MYRILLLKKSLYTINTVQKIYLTVLVLSPRFQNLARVAGGRKNRRGKTVWGRGEKSRFCLGGAQISVEGLEALKSFSLEHVQRDIGHGVGHTHGCDTGAHGHTLPGGGSQEAGSCRSFPAFPVSACGGRWRDADPASEGRRDRLKPRGQTGHLDARERWGPPGSPPPWAMRTCPPGRGAERGRKWEEIGDDTPGLPPPPALAGGTLYITAPLPEPHDPHPTTQLKQEVGGTRPL